MSEATQSRLDAAFEAQRPMLWGLAYRMTGSRADADDVVQDAWVRLRERPPDASRDVAPWLTRVTMNVARDRLRSRKRTYSGPWLPEPVALADATPASDDRLLVRESASFAYLVALEALTPLQRAVLLLREVFELSAKETAVALDATEGGVRAALHRARRALASGAGAATGHAARSDAHRGAMAQLLPALFSGDLAAVEAGREVTVVADAYPSERFAGTIASVASEAEFTPRNVQTREDRDRLVYAVRARFTNPERRLRPGMPVEVHVGGGS